MWPWIFGAIVAGVWYIFDKRNETINKKLDSIEETLDKLYEWQGGYEREKREKEMEIEEEIAKLI